MGDRSDTIAANALATAMNMPNPDALRIAQLCLHECTGRLLLPALVLCLAGGASRANPAKEEAARTLRADSRAPHHHCITLYDADGEAISPDDEPAQPWSPDRTCGKCHDTTAVQHGWHFNAMNPKARPGRSGEPWILVDPDSLTQLPLSYRPLPHVFHPARLGIGPWEFIQLFGRHTPGNIGPGMPGAGTNSPKARWEISGKLEIDCLICHTSDGSYDPVERAAQISRQNFMWAPTAAAGLAAVRGAAAKAPDDWDPMEPPDPDHPEQAGPRVKYEENRFNADDRVYFPITGRPAAARCYFCHTVRETGPHAPPAWQTDQDVHLASGLTCVDCHRNGIDHAMTRGCPAADSATPGITSLTCAGCHLASGDPAGLGGRHGAPFPMHSGLPEFHLKELSCTACHSGLRPTAWTRHVQTSRAHALGLPRKGRRADALPIIVEPVFLRDAAGVITPYRGFWPSFFGIQRKNGGVDPLPPDKVDPLIPGRIRRKSHAARDVWTPFTKKKLAAVLAAVQDKLLAGAANETAVYVCAGQCYFLKNGHLKSKPGGTAAALCAWPVAHDVRPAAQALGARDCMTCHAQSAPFFFGRIQAQPNLEGRRTAFLRAEMMGVDPRLMKTWAVVIRFRGLMLAVFAGSGFVILGTLLHYGLLGLAALASPPRENPEAGAEA